MVATAIVAAIVRASAFIPTMDKGSSATDKDVKESTLQIEKTPLAAIQAAATTFPINSKGSKEQELIVVGLLS